MRSGLKLLVAVGGCIPTAAGAAAVDSNMVGYWSFETGMSNKGSGGAALDATVLSGTPTPGVSTGRAGNGLGLVKSESDAIQLPVGTAVLGQNFSIAAWYRHSGDTSSSRSFVFEGSNNYDVSFGTNTTTNTYVSYVGQTSIGTKVLEGDTWHHVVHSFSSNGTTTALQVYIDGVNQNYSPNTAATSSMNFASINVGAARDSAGRYFNGMIDEIAVWDRTLTENEAVAVYDLGLAGQAIPEPASTALLGVVAAGLLAGRRRNRVR